MRGADDASDVAGTERTSDSFGRRFELETLREMRGFLRGGSTVRPCLEVLEEERRDFRRGLRLRELLALDRLRDHARAHERPGAHHAMILRLQGQEAELADPRARLVRAAGAHAEDEGFVSPAQAPEA